MTNEELQASNEKFQTVNDELRERTDELNRTNAFQESILASLHVAAVVVDRSFSILMWNHHANELWGLYLEELQDRSFLNLDIGLPSNCRVLYAPCCTERRLSRKLSWTP